MLLKSCAIPPGELAYGLHALGMPELGFQRQTRVFRGSARSFAARALYFHHHAVGKQSQQCLHPFWMLHRGVSHHGHDAQRFTGRARERKPGISRESRLVDLGGGELCLQCFREVPEFPANDSGTWGVCERVAEILDPVAVHPQGNGIHHGRGAVLAQHRNHGHVHFKQLDQTVRQILEDCLALGGGQGNGCL